MLFDLRDVLVFHQNGVCLTGQRVGVDMEAEWLLCRISCSHYMKEMERYIQHSSLFFTAFLFHFNFPLDVCLHYFLPCKLVFFLFHLGFGFILFPFFLLFPFLSPHIFPFPRLGCSCGTQPARRGSAASFPATSVTLLQLSLSLTLQVGTKPELLQGPCF